VAEGRSWRRVLVWVGAFVGLLVAACFGCVLMHPDATTRLARQFDLDDVSSEQAIEAGLVAKLPVGTSESEVGAYLQRCGIGRDRLSSWYPANKDGEIVCRIEYDVAEPALVKESYCVFFRLDERRTLAAIRVKRWLTGL
jgi:hypothetical protein